MIAEIVWNDRPMQVTTVLSPATGKAHDRVLVDGGFLGVADGATPLTPQWPQEVGAFTETALAELAWASRQQRLPIREVWRQAIRRAAATHGAQTPFLSCGVACVRPVGDTLELACLGDCGIVLRRRGRPAEQFQDFALTDLDRAVEDRAAGLEESLVRNRHKMNQVGGYWAFAGDPHAADHIVTASVPVDEVEALLLYSDGFYRLLDPYLVVDSVDGLLETALNGLEAAVTRLRDHESERPASGGLFDRGDDASAVLAVPTRTGRPTRAGST